MMDGAAAGGRWQRCENSARLGLDQMWGENRSQQYHCAARASPGKRVSAAEGGDSGE